MTSAFGSRLGLAQPCRRRERALPRHAGRPSLGLVGAHPCAPTVSGGLSHGGGTRRAAVGLPKAEVTMQTSTTHKLCIAPMMDRTDRHLRYLLRLLAPHARLVHGDDHGARVAARRCRAAVALRSLPSIPSRCSSAVAIPDELAAAARLGRARGVRRDQSERRLSERPRAGRVLRCRADARAEARRGVRARDARGRRRARHRQDAARRRSITTRTSSCAISSREVAAAGCTTFIVHARKAWLSGLSPKQNREIPPLDYAARVPLEARVSGALHRHQRRVS